MTRGKWVALAVGVAAVAVLVCNGPALWRAVAYTEERTNDFVIYLPPDVESVDVPGYVILTRKRLRWLPGPDETVLCAWCAESSHANCTRQVHLIQKPPSEPAFKTLTCTCPHPSHDQD